MTDSPDDLAAALRRSIGAVVRAARSQPDALPQAHAATLGLLDRAGPMTIAALARRRGVKHQGQSRTVGELVALGYVVTEPSTEDRRATVVRIAETGTQVLQRDRDARTDWLAAAIREELDDEERAVLRRLPGMLDRLARRAD